MNEMKQLMTELTDRLRKTNEYNQYINVLSRLKQDSELFADLQENGLANEFFAAEHQYIAMVKELQEQFLEGSAVETSFLEG